MGGCISSSRLGGIEQVAPLGDRSLSNRIPEQEKPSNESVEGALHQGKSDSEDEGAETRSVRLVGFPMCLNTARICMELQHKGLTVDLVWLSPEEVNENIPRWLIELSPEGKLPVLQHADKVLFGSPDETLTYIESKFPSPNASLPDKFHRKVKEWVSFVDNELTPLVQGLMLDASAPRSSDEMVKLDACLRKLEKGLLTYSKGGPYFMGRRCSRVDIYLGPLSAFIALLHEMRGLDVSRYPGVHKYFTFIESCPEYVLVSLDKGALRDSLLIGEAATGDRPAILTLALLQHQAVRRHFQALVRHAESLAAGAVDEDTMKSLRNGYSHLLDIMQEHAQMEERVLFPAIEAFIPGSTDPANSDHANAFPRMNGIREDIKTALGLTKGSPDMADVLEALLQRMRTFCDSNESHFNKEEELYSSVEQTLKLGDTSASIVIQMLEVMETTHGQHLKFLLSVLNREQTQQYVHVLKEAVAQDSRWRSILESSGL